MIMKTKINRKLPFKKFYNSNLKFKEFKSKFVLVIYCYVINHPET